MFFSLAYRTQTREIVWKCSLNTERSYKWRLSGSAGQSEIGTLCFDWLIHPGVSYSREICNFSGEFVIFQATAEGKIFRLFAFFLKRSAKTTRMTSTEHEFRHLHLIYMHFNLLFSLFHLWKHIDCFRVVYSMPYACFRQSANRWPFIGSLRV